jgi:hypothetical protein
MSVLADLGYVEGRKLAIEFRYGDDAIARCLNWPRNWFAYQRIIDFGIS